MYADFSALSFFEGVHGQAELLRGWLSQWPEKVLFGTDATPNTDETSWEETGWIASQTAREALAIALTGMIRTARSRAPAPRSSRAWCCAKTRRSSTVLTMLITMLRCTKMPK